MKLSFLINHLDLMSEQKGYTTVRLLLSAFGRMKGLHDDGLWLQNHHVRQLLIGE
jgi:hypothetical protein